MLESSMSNLNLVTNDACEQKMLALKASDTYRYNCNINYYNQLSWANKLTYLAVMVKNVTSIDSLLLLSHTMQAGVKKSFNYSKTMVDNNYNYDQVLFDHNRMLEDEDIAEMNEYDLEWFKNISDSLQELLIIALFREGGGSLTEAFYDIIIKETYCRQLKAEKSLKKVEDVFVNDEQFTVIKQISYNKETNSSAEVIHAPDDLKHIIFEKLDKEYEAYIASYKIRVYGKPPKVEEASKKQGKGKKEKKSKKASSKSKSKTSKTSKSSKKKKSSKSELDNSNIDHIELLPIWIVLQIFSYLDDKSLANAKQVSAYWRFAIEQLQNERKTRSYLNKTIEKLKMDLDDTKNIQLELINEPCKSMTLTKPELEVKQAEILKTKKGFNERKMRSLKNRGAILNKLRSTEDQILNEYSVLVDTLQKHNTNPIYPIQHSGMYSRVRKTNCPIIERKNIFYKDCNLIVIHRNKDREDLEENKSTTKFQESKGSSSMLLSSQTST